MTSLDILERRQEERRQYVRELQAFIDKEGVRIDNIKAQGIQQPVRRLAVVS